jgi:hypothetical protein
LIAAALSAIPLIAQAGQGLINTVGQDVSSFLGAGQTGQNVPASAGSGTAGATQSANPITLSSVARSLSSDVMSALNGAQHGLGAASSFAGGQSSLSKSQFESAAQTISGALGQNPGAAAGAAGQVFDAINTNGSGQITAGQVDAYLGQLQTQATGKYQAAANLVNGVAGQMSSLLGLPQTSTTA